MKVAITSDPLHKIDTHAIVIGIWKDEPLSGSAQEFDRATNGRLTRLIELEEVSAAVLDTTLVVAPPEIQATVVLIVGLGTRDEAENGLGFRAAAAAARKLSEKSRKSVAFYLDDLYSSESVAGCLVGCVGQDIYRKKKNTYSFEQIWWASNDQNKTDQASIDRGVILGESTNLTRRLVNEPANIIYPESFADECERVGEESGFDVEVWDQKKLEQEKCGALLAVNRASDREPRIVIMRYNGGKNNSKPLALVGKGVTFDSGGLSIKPSPSMLDMKCDMAGAATVLGAMRAIAQLKLPINVMGLVGLAENMISGRAYKLGDVLKARSGKTIEVHNTDAEGRLVLADVLNVAVESGAERLIDLATLTGACVVALGRNFAGFMSNDQAWCDQVLKATNEAGEFGWQLPMHKEFNKDIKSHVADIKNVGDGRFGGAITAAKFLEEFVEATPWVHIDIAGPSFGEKPQAWIDAGASGCFVRTLVQVTENLAK